MLVASLPIFGLSAADQVSASEITASEVTADSSDNELLSFVAAQYSKQSVDAVYLPTYIQQVTPSDNSKLTKGKALSIKFKIRDTWKSYFCKPLTCIFDSNNNIVDNKVFQGDVCSTNNAWNTYTGTLDYTKNFPAGSYTLFIVDAPCYSNGNLVDNWSSFDCPSITTPFTVTSSKTNIKNCSIKIKDTTLNYTGKNLTPSITVKKGSTTLKKNTDYTLTFNKSTRKEIGTYKVTIKGIGKYTGSVTKSFKIVPKGTKFTSVKPTADSVTLKWTAQKTKTNGYQIQIATRSSFSDAETYFSSISKTKRIIEDLDSDTKYYVRIRTYKIVNGEKVYADWSATKSFWTEVE